MARLTKERDRWSDFIKKKEDDEKAAKKAVADELKISKQNPGKEEGGRSPYEPWKPAPSGPYTPAPKDKWQVNADGIPRNIDLSSNAPVWPADKWPHPTPGQGPLPNPNLPEKLANQLQIDGTLIAGLPWKKKDTSRMQGHWTDQAIRAWAESNGSMSTLPKGWTPEEALKYNEDYKRGLLKPR